MRDVTVNQKVARGDKWELRLGDCIEELSTMDSGVIDYCVYSPPFCSLYTYSDSPRDMGNCGDNETFYKHFGFLAEQLARVMRPGRLMSFHCMALPTSKARHGFIGLSDFPGDLIRIFQKVGFIYHSEVVIWKDPVTAMQRTKALGLLHKQAKKDSCMSRQGIPDKVITMRAPGENTRPVTKTDVSMPVGADKAKALGQDERHCWQNYASPVWMDINPSKTLQKDSARDEKDERHICPLQLEVIERCVELWSNPGDLVLSPFAGIGSEGHVALRMGRRFIGVELKESYWDVACENLCEASEQFGTASLF